ncbi:MULTISPECIES: dihydrolipoyl dehydrogenase [Burkholderia]|uniref:Dihydrolipoyl dehydrogenase n=1 Tax=Burkholderia gladioli TaxID=28095 RepID=A0AB38U4U1_BURGA|nr:MULTISPECIES: dihydrolipoyl dehydrogenase [Burkholderia]KAF1059287.1 Dihydrolipoyl dehydrogenase [Burkholderia gladioli]MBU9217841.1 dihydrolipoyl dehydrogenase [Burkholderia gladioli]MBU9266270.1 dihydrolipoyl dehydrogenase [Burkholderia gladioli]MBU9321725.1 dihydrolipoyl dehydrogenase [Burkholderia gladioli]MCA8170334.1 dihydrolipoyl dehydrogenase [Burkholderia gladioli]
MSEPINTTLLVIGGGPGGYVAAIRAAQLGVPTVLVERARLGGTCLNIGCIPSKALIHAAEEFDKARHYAKESPLGISVASPAIDIGRTVAWKDGIVARLTGGIGTLMKRHGVDVLQGEARVIDGKTVEVAREGGEPLRVRGEHLLLAAGSEPVALPSMPFGGIVQSSTEALSPSSLPRRLVVVGAGYIGLELAIAYRKLGVEVAVVEAQARILPAWDEALTKPVAASLGKLGIALHLERKVLGLNAGGDAVRIQDAAGAEHALPADRVLVAVGRRPRTQGWGLEALQLDREGHALKIDDQCRTSMRNVWAIGDLTGEPMLAHRAMAQGEMVAEIVSGKRRRFMPAAIPAVCFTDPEVVSVGLAPHDAATPEDALVASFPLSVNSRAMTLESSDGFVRVVARRDDHLILGWQAVGRGVSELSAAFAQSLEMGARLEDVGGTIHAHPTLGEAVMEAALRALGHALHI